MVDSARALPWLADAEERATSWIIATGSPPTSPRSSRAAQPSSNAPAQLVTKRLEQESEPPPPRCGGRAEKERAGEKAKEPRESLNRKAADLDVRLRRRLALLDQQVLMSTKPPRIVAAGLVLPLRMLEGEIPADAPMHAKETKEVERRGVDLVLARERELGRGPVEQAFNNPASTSSPPTRRATPTGSRSRPGSQARPTSSSPTTRC